MAPALIILYACLLLVNVAFVIAWITATRRRRFSGRPTVGDLAIGCGTTFLDNLGIGNYAQITALFKLRGHPADELIPGTLNVGNAIPSGISTVLFAAAFKVEPVLLT